jgi:hypothetical protein
VIRLLGKEYLDYEDRLANVTYALRHPEQFVPAEYNSETLTDLKSRLEQALDKLVEAASKCYRRPGECRFPEPGTLPDVVVQLPPRLDRTTRDAIEQAKSSYERARRHAEECIELAGQILRISRDVKVGPDGKGSADKAKVLFSSVETAATNAVRASEDAESVSNLSEEVCSWVAKAQEMAAQAIQTRESSEKNSQLSYDVGYAPY